MLYITRLSCTGEFSDSPAFALFDLAPQRASLLLDLATMTHVFRDEAARRELASSCFAVSLGSDLGAFEALRSTEELEEAMDGEEAVAVAPGFLVGADDRVRVECFRVNISQNGLFFGALPKSGDYVIRLSQDLSYSFLAEIAGLPVPPELAGTE